jgi:lysophospholipase
LRSAFLFYFLVSFLAGSVVPLGAVVEKEISELSNSKIMPYFLEHFIPGSLQTHDGVEISYAKSEVAGQAGALVVVVGRTEFMAKYSEVFYDLRNTGLSFYIYDHRGQGESTRLLSDREKGHVEHFDDYIEDLHLFLDTVVKTGSHGPIFLLSHSMGATISVLHERKYPGTVAGMILSSPMFSVNTAPFPPLLARGLSRVFTFLGLGTRYVIGGKPYDHRQMFEKNVLTDSFARFELNKRRVEENPRVALGSPTFTWLAEAFSAMDRVRNDTVNLQTPMLVLVGEEDVVVGRTVQKDFCDARPNCSFVLLPRGKHELLMEKDQVRDLVLSHISGFLRRFGAGGCE